jgi:SH3-like domain-containing protein
MNFRRLRRYAPILPLAALAAGGIALLPNPDAPDPQLAVAKVEPVQPSYLAVPIATVEPLPVKTAERPVQPRPSLAVTTAALAAPVVTPQLPDPEDDTEAATEVAYVGASALNVRAGPSSSTAKLFVLQPGTKVATAESEGGWVRIIAADGQEGWVFGRYLGSDAPQQRPAASEPAKPARDVAATSGSQQDARQTGRTARIAGRVTLRSSPSGLSQRLFVLEPGERVVIAERRGNWARVVVDGGMSGWVRLN